jgi:probable phosphoglycerate mutase
MIQIILVRHGRTAWNVGEGHGPRFRGIADVPLAEEGAAQATVTARRLGDEPLTAIYASPLQRAARTAHIIAAPHGLPVQIMAGLGSINYGDWTGLPLTEVAHRWPDLYSQWRRDPFSIQIPNGDSAADLRRRAIAAVQEILARHASGDTVVLVTHQVVTKTLACALTGLPQTAYWRVHQDLCNLSRIDYDPSPSPHGSGPILAGLNDTNHLDPALPRSGSTGLRLVLIRHGQTAWNAGAGQDRFRGRTDLPLDDVGRAQAQAVALRLQGESIAALYSSPLLRARQTIAPSASALDLPLRSHDGLVDIHYGRFQGLTHAEAEENHSELYGLWRTAPGEMRFPGGEGLSDVRARLLTLVDGLTARHSDQTVVLVGHQIVNKALVCALLDLDLDRIWRIRHDTAALSVFQDVGGSWQALRLNDTYHLA